MTSKQASVTQPIEPYVDTETVSAYLGKPESWIHNRATSLCLPRVKVGQHWRYKISTVDEWVRNGAGR